MKIIFCLLVTVLAGLTMVQAQTAEGLIQKVKEKLDKVNDYEANGKMKMNVVFIKAPVSSIKVYFKKPDKLKINNEKGISLVPKGAVNISIGAILTNASNYDIIDGGIENKTGLHIVKLLPRDETTDLVLVTFYIDEAQSLVKKARATTRESGTYELELSYGKYSEYGLADKVVFSFNTKDYKLPKGVTFDYNDGSTKEPTDKLKNRKGRVEITYSEYRVNKGVADSVFQ